MDAMYIQISLYKIARVTSLFLVCLEMFSLLCISSDTDFQYCFVVTVYFLFFIIKSPTKAIALVLLAQGSEWR